MESYATIPFEDSVIRGIEKTSSNGKKYYAFLGIPYAKPPVGDLRFKPPQTLENFPKFLDATEFRDCCIQYNEFAKAKMGSEDCLYLNIFVPKLPSSDSFSLLPVAIYFHGGAFRHLSANSLFPHLLIEHDLIFVTLNYRLHVLGFLNLGLPECPGNVGLKDQLCALQWVKNNIKWFGGDADNVTMSGISSGALSAQMLVMSPLNTNLANKIILQGGDALNSYNINPSPLKLAFEFGRKFGYEGDDKETLLKLLKSVTFEKLLDAVLALYDENLERPRTCVFRPSAESIEEGAVLPDTPKNLWKKVNSVSVMNGINVNEGTIFLRGPSFNQLIVRHAFLKLIISELTGVKTEFLDEMFEEIISFYGIAEKDDQENFDARLKLFTDLFLKQRYARDSDFLRSAAASESYTIFNYVFAYCGDHNILRQMRGPGIKWAVEGTFHADDMGYLMTQEDKWYTPAKDFETANTLCTLWANFIKYGNPNGKCFEGVWMPSTKETPRYLQIDEKLTMRNENVDSERIKFWRYLTEKYSL